MKKTGKTISFQGKQISVEAARAMANELIGLLAEVDPVTSDDPVGIEMPMLVNPCWYVEAHAELPGSLFCVRDPGLGWRGCFLPWDGVAHLIGLLANQMGLAATGPVEKSKIH